MEGIKKVYTDFYNVNEKPGSTYIHSHWISFNFIFNRNKESFDFESIEKNVYNSLQTVIANMVDREIQFYEKLEQDYVDSVNKNGSKQYDGIQELYKDFEEIFKRKSEETVLGSLIRMSAGLDKYRTFLGKVNDRVKSTVSKNGGNLKDNKIRKKEIEKILQEKKENVEFIEGFLKTIQEVYEFAINGEYLLGNKEKRINVEKKSIIKLRENYKASLEYAKKNKITLSQEQAHKKILTLLGDENASPLDFLDIFSIHSVPKDFFDLSKALQTSSKIGNVFEDLIPELLITEDLQQFVTWVDSKDKKPISVGAEWEKDNITDTVFAEIVHNEQKIKIGASLKLKAQDSTRNQYRLPNIWGGKIDGAKTSEEEALLKKAQEKKDLIEWIKNNYISLNSYSEDEKDDSGVKLIVDRLFEAEEKLGSWILLPRFFNGFLKELEDGKFGVYKKDKLNEVAFTIFIISGDKVFLTTQLLKNIRRILLGDELKNPEELRGNISIKGRSNLKDVQLNQGLLKDLYAQKRTTWDLVKNVTYLAIMNNPSVKDILEKINFNLSSESIVREVEYDINFEKAKNLSFK